jgi:TPP-dependent pyruvate/acetoin dehydrogenase alpha subunit
MKHTAESLTAFEAEVAARFNEGKIRAPIHLSGGCEKQLIEVFEKIGEKDWVFSNWRSHYHALLHGVPPERVMAEIMAGRSIALCFPEHRFFSSAIVGGNLPIALGVALGIKRRGGSERVYVFVGDMTAGTGAFHECMTYAFGHDLPIRFVVERNGKSVCTPTQEVWGGDRVPPPYRPLKNVVEFDYELPWPHSGAGKRIEF